MIFKKARREFFSDILINGPENQYIWGSKKGKKVKTKKDILNKK